MSNEQSETNRRSAGDKKGPSTNGSGSNADGGFGQPHFTPDFSTGWRNTMQQRGASSQQGGPIDHAYNNYFYPGAGYSPFSGDIRDSIAAIWSRTSPSGEGVAPAFAGGYGQFPDSSAGQFAANSTPAGQFNQSAAGTFAANLTGHYAAQSELSMFGAAPTGGDYSPYAAAAASAGYNYGAQYTQWPDNSTGRGAYSYLGAGGIQDQDSRGDRVSEVQAGMEGMKLQGGQRKETNGYSSGGGQPKKMSWANVASQPAKPQAPPQKVKKPGVLSPPAIISSPKPVPTEPPTKEQQQPMVSPPQQPMPPPVQQQPPPMQQQGPPPMQQGGPPRGTGPSNQGPRQARGVGGHGGNSGNNQSEGMKGGKAHSHPVLDNLRSVNDYNPRNFDLSPKNARFFVIKSFSEDDIHRSIKYEIWCSTDHGNKRLDAAFKERQGKGPIYLFFSVNGSGHFCGMAQMLTGVDYSNTNCVWVQDKFKGQFKVKWVYVKDVPNGQLRHIRLENNENKPVTNSRDTQEVPPEKGRLVLKIIHGFKHSTSIFDDFIHYEKRQEEEEGRKQQQQKMGDEPKIPDGRGDGGPRRQPRNDRPKN